MNWIKAFCTGLEPERVWLDSLAMQVRWLRERIEWHVLGNHLFVNAKALVHAGLFFKVRKRKAGWRMAFAFCSANWPSNF